MRFKTLITLLIALIAVGCQSTGATKTDSMVGHDSMGQHHKKLTQHYKGSLFKMTDSGQFSLELVVKGDGMKVGTNEMDVIIHNARDHDVVDAKIRIIPWMPDHGHGIKSSPDITPRGGGIYTIKDLELTMPGRWEIKFHIKAEGKEDTAVFEFMLGKRKSHSHGVAPHDGPSMSMPSSFTVISNRELFEVTYSTPDTFRIPLNKIHTWMLTVETPSEEPVTGATITVDGGMPAHGHGLPTKPTVSASHMAGHYMVQGMKFNMPGAWVVKFNIDTGSKKDTAEFRLEIK